ncbi:hypothetical protein [Thermodesulfovibrio yellowstonii]|uniref:hypothetical protein n=1 Tax=Thermodesulfovibrio yellowstonii TaxID=28262 RepID=UPI003C7DBEB0
MHPLKCRFCLFKEDDHERTVNISRGTFKDNDFDFIYNIDKDTFEPAIYEADYVVVTCPTLKCERVYYISKEEMPTYLVKVTQEDEESFKNIPYEEPLYIHDLVEEGNLMCKQCSHSTEHPDEERKAFVMYRDIYINSLSGEPSVNDCIPDLIISCKNKKCLNAFVIPPKGQVLESVIEVKPSKLLAKLGISSGGSLKDIKPWDTKKIVEFFLSPEAIQHRILENLLSASTGYRIAVVREPKEDQKK